MRWQGNLTGRMALAYPHRVAFLPPHLRLQADATPNALLYAKLLGALIADHFARHSIVSVFDPEDQTMADRNGVLVDVAHPDVESSIDWLFRTGRRNEVLWLEIGLDPSASTEPVHLRARRPRGAITTYRGEGSTISEQLSHTFAQWLTDRRLPTTEPLPTFTHQDMHRVVLDLARTLAAVAPRPHDATPTLPDGVLAPPPRLAAAYYRVLADLADIDASLIYPRLLEADARHLSARLHHVISRLGAGSSRRDLLPLVAEAPMFGAAHLSIFGEEFDDDYPDEGASLRHQGLATQLQPANPWACRRYATELSNAGRFEEAYRWFDRAVVANPGMRVAMLDAIRALRECQRSGATFIETTKRCGELLAALRSGNAGAGVDRSLRRAAGLLVAQAHLDVGRLGDAIEIASDPNETSADPDPDLEARRALVRDWADDPDLFARAYACEGFHRGEFGRVLIGFGHSSLRTAEDVRMLIETLIAIGRDDEAVLVFHQALGMNRTGIVGFGRTRLSGARAMMLTGDLDGAVAHIQTVQLRRSQYRLETDINRTLRLAAIHPAPAWAAVIQRLAARGAYTLARMAARDLADFVPDMDLSAVRTALGERHPFAVNPAWREALAADLGLDSEVTTRIDQRLSRPIATTLTAADELFSKWFTAVPPPARDAALHASATIYALGLALAEYFALASEIPTPIAGAYRQIASEALHLCHRARFEVRERAVRGLLTLLEHIPVDDESLDPWLLRVERALDLEATWGGYLPYIVADLPKIRRLLRGDERIGWELRLAHDLRRDPSQVEPATRLLARTAVAADDWAVFRTWSDTASVALPPHAALDVHWTCTRANPRTNAIAWVHAAEVLFSAGRVTDAVAALSSAYDNTTREWRQASIAAFESRWQAARVDVPFAADAARTAARTALASGDFNRAERCLRWAFARDPGNPELAGELGIAGGLQGGATAAICAFAAVDGTRAAWLAGRAMFEHGHPLEAMRALRLASLQFRTADEWRALATAAWYAGDPETAANASRAMIAAGSAADLPTLHLLLSSLVGSGQWAEAEHVAQRLGSLAGADPAWAAIAAAGRARALCGQARYGEALPWAAQAAERNVSPEHAAEIADTLACARNRTVPGCVTGRANPGTRATELLLAGDVAGCARLARSGATWDLRTAELLAAAVHTPGEDERLISPRALEAASSVLDRSCGAIERDAVRARILALRIVEDAFIQIDPPPPPGSRVDTADFERLWMERVARYVSPDVT